MNLSLLLPTVLNLKPKQVLFQIKNRIIKAKYVQLSAPTHDMLKLKAEPISRIQSLDGDEFTFLNLTHKFTNWNFVDNGTLFTYNQNYFDFINTEDVKAEEACQWIDKFIAERTSITWGLDPYPIALRAINWMKFFCKNPKCITKVREDSLWSQLNLLEKKLEYHLLGNHLLEDAYALYMGGCYFQDERFREKGYKLVLKQLYEQTLSDGAHYEQSPMYHCILLDRLLDCINFGTTEELKSIAQKQLGWLQAICYKDGSWPMSNDAALGIAPDTDRIFDYAKRLGLSWTTAKLGVSGYRKMQEGNIEAVIDCGQITATYQPGHSHADTFNYELRMNGKPFVVDTGISTYDKTARRQYERSTEAHNCVVVDGKSSSEVWGGFRVGKRCKVTLLKDYPHCIEAYHNGFKKKCYRTFTMSDNTFIVEDRYDGYAVSLIHLAPDADMNKIKIEGADKIEIRETKYSVEYNRFIPNKTIAVHFNGKMSYRISC